jgi:hypothetical protein
MRACVSHNSAIVSFVLILALRQDFHICVGLERRILKLCWLTSTAPDTAKLLEPAAAAFASLNRDGK